MLMSLSIHLHGLHLDTQYRQTWHLSTQLRSGERTGRRLLWSTTPLLPTLLSDSQVSISLVIHGLWWTVSGQVKAHVVLTANLHKWGLTQSPSCDCGQRQSMNYSVYIFHFNRWESVWEIQHYCCELSFVDMYNKYKAKFLSSIISTD